MLLVFNKGVNALHDKRLLSLGKLAEIHIEILQSLVVGVDVIVFIVRFSEQIIGSGVEDVGDLDDLFKCGARTSDLPTADRRLFNAEFFSQLALRRVVLLPQGF